MKFTRRGRAAPSPADEDVDDGHRFLYPTPHEDAMLVIRDALLSQLQKDRLRLEVILAELAKIEGAMVLRNKSRHGIATANAEWTKRVPFTFRDEFMPYCRWSISPERYADVDEIHHPKIKDGRHGSVELKFRKPAMEDRVSECLRPCCNGMAGQENAKLEEQKIQEFNERIQEQPKKTLPSMKWELTGVTIPVKKPPPKLSCGICQVQATSERSFQEHCAGRKHRSNLATLESRNKAITRKAEKTAEPSCIKLKTSSIKWSCSTCQANGTSEANLKEHLNGRTHQQNIEAQCKEGSDLPKNVDPQETKWHKSNAPQLAENPPPIWSCSTCQANCCESGSESLLLVKIQALLDKRKSMARNSELQEASVVPQHAEQPASRCNCSICQANCNRHSELENHLVSKKHEDAKHEESIQTHNIAKNQQPLPGWDCIICHKSNGLQHAEKQPPIRSCSICQDSYCEPGSENLLLAKIQALLEQRNSMAWNSESPEANVVTQHAEHPASRCNCSTCQANWNLHSEPEGHLVSKKHEDAKQAESIQTHIAKNQQPLPGWDCVICQAKCYSESQFEHHCRGRKHQKKMESVQGEDKNPKSSVLETDNNVLSDGFDSNSSTSDKVEEQTTLYVCDVCNLQCDNRNMLGEHCRGEKHLEKQKLLNFCEVCNLQCNSGKMLAHHRTGKKHQKNLNESK